MRCPITYQELEPGLRYSLQGIKMLSRKLGEFRDFPYTIQEQLEQARQRAVKMSIQGVQPKISAVLSLKAQTFQIVDTGGRFILKPQVLEWPEVPQNEDLSMRLATLAGVGVPEHGMVFGSDGSLVYFVRRFDRRGNNKIAVEDFGQLAGLSRNTKYDYSMEKTVGIVDRFCTFPAIEKLRLLRLTLVNFLIGNEDAHVKNFSLIKRGVIVELAPAYDLVNSTIVLNGAAEIALPISGKRNRLQRAHFFEYLAKERMRLPVTAVRKVEKEIAAALPEWPKLIKRSFLSAEAREGYAKIVAERAERLGFGRFQPTQAGDARPVGPTRR
ncbi:MAG: type II toxin-antitoxin system HipA family toxin [Acidobacteria bacterium]|nr:MAG: type II toxin-antitoxin system HipA family toxin [Acidobacteriota bacterium]